MSARKIKKFSEGGTPDWMNEPSLEPVYPVEDALLGNAVVKGAFKGISALADAIKQRAVLNKIVDVGFGKGNILNGRLPQSADEITYAYRNMSPAELEFAKNKGFFGRRPSDIKKSWSDSGKWWSPGDDAGSFGRTWKGGESSETVRVPVNKVPKIGAVRKKNAQVLNKETGKYEPFKKGGNVNKKVKSASNRADGCVRRGKTRGRIV